MCDAITESTRGHLHTLTHTDTQTKQAMDTKRPAPAILCNSCWLLWPSVSRRGAGEGQAGRPSALSNAMQRRLRTPTSHSVVDPPPTTSRNAEGAPPHPRRAPRPPERVRRPPHLPLRAPASRSLAAPADRRPEPIHYEQQEHHRAAIHRRGAPANSPAARQTARRQTSPEPTPGSALGGDRQTGTASNARNVLNAYIRTMTLHAFAT